MVETSKTHSIVSFKVQQKQNQNYLDELGIILRLDIAARKYGAQIGKNFRDLTTYEKEESGVEETTKTSI